MQSAVERRLLDFLKQQLEAGVCVCLCMVDLVCFGLRSDVTTRAQACFGHCKRCKRCVFLRACHVNYLLGLGWRQDCFAQCRRCKKCVFLRACHVHCHAGLGGVGWDALTFVAHEHMFDATQQLGLGWGGMGCVNIRCT